MPSFLFKPLCENDLNLLHHWFKEPIINQWYARGKSWSVEDITQKYLQRIQGKEYVPSFIIYQHERPIGFIQYYLLTEHLPEGIPDFNHPLFKCYKASELVGLDLFLAEAISRGKGFGEQILRCFISKLPLSTKAVIVDPNSANHQAIRCYLKAGFQLTTYSENDAYQILFKTI